MAFTAGILMGLGPKASLHDGGEKAYDISRHKRIVALKREIRRAGLKHSADSDLYRKRMKHSFGIWLDFRSVSYGGWYQDPFLNHFTPRDLGAALQETECHRRLLRSDPQLQAAAPAGPSPRPSGCRQRTAARSCRVDQDGR